MGVGSFNLYDRRSNMAAIGALIFTILTTNPITLFLATMFILALAVLVLALRIPL